MADLWWKGAVIYQIYPRSYRDTNGDGVGDLKGVIEKLPYVADLGVDGIWLSPFFTSPMHDFGYDVADYCDVDPVFGTLQDFDTLLSEAHDRGLKLIIDQVYSHTSDRHPWFRDSRQRRNGRDDWYVWADAKEDGTPPNNWLSVFGGPAWSWDTGRRQYYLHNFLREQPDLNFHNEEVQEEILETAKFWLERGVDGFRLDVANYYLHDDQLRDNPPSKAEAPKRPYDFQRHVYNRSRPENLEFIERFRTLLDSHDAKMAVAEVFSDKPIERSTEYTEGPKRLHTAYSFSFLHAEEMSAGLIRSALEAWTSPEAWPSWSFSNHDVARVLTRWGGEDAPPECARMLIALLTCLRGTAFIYQGEELGLPQADVPYEMLKDPEAIRFWPDNLGRDGCRTPMPWVSEAENVGFGLGVPWLPIDPRHKLLAVDLQEADPDSVLHFTRNFLELRKGQPALQSGSITFHDAPEPVLAFTRKSGEDAILCVFNLSSVEAALPDGIAVRAGKPLETGLLAYREDGGIILPPYGGLLSYRL
ncbi:alpha-glucosidase [Parvularcula lutaonensis]|uniref:Alpha-glucosidase n=1 Tax=Parvularcula lutaonensis TaxID=491923 RepID=A0ABV7M6Y9_9PROT|nr:alpha-glucosidase [Parvularcula lutaonensis]GGY57081.1 alpha-glucosidase [Parvularcula lutaonensis]